MKESHTSNELLNSLSRNKPSGDRSSSSSPVVGRRGQGLLLNDVRVHCDQITEHLKMSLRRPCKFYEKKLNHPSVLKRHLGAHSFSGDCACTGCGSSYDGKAMIRECLQGKHLGSKTWTSGEGMFLPPVQGKPKGEDVFLPPVQGQPRGEDVFLPPGSGQA